jgi:hypothetical protein
MEKFRKVRLYKPGDETGIRTLFNKVFEREMSSREWEWKYIDSNPSKVYSIVAEDDKGDIVGHYGSVCVSMVYEGKPVRGLAICDVMIHPKFRGIRALKTLSALIPAEAIKDNIFVGYGFPNLNTLLRPALMLDLYEKVEDVLQGTKDAEFHNNIFRYLYKFFPLDYSDERIDLLWDSCKTGFPLAVIRNRKYLAWRYRNHPFLHYELWGMKKRLGNKLLGIAVLSKDKDMYYLMDFLSPENVMDVLFKKVENYVFSAGGGTLVLWYPPFLRSKITSMGFSTSNAPTAIPCTTHRGALKKNEIKNRFFYTMGDTDLV